jgi:hypothetical protein
MGVSYSAEALIGIKVERELFVIGTKKVKRFNHNYPEEISFCPNTGRKLWNEEVQYHPLYNEDKETFGGFSITTNDSDTWIVIVRALDRGYDSENVFDFKQLPVDLESKKQKLRELLEPLGAWKEEKFGLYTVLHCD